MNEDMERNERFPIIPLRYENRHLAHKKELLVGDEGRLYVVDAEDKTKIWDITAEILKLTANQVDGNNIFVNIEGVGLINLKTYLQQMKESGVDVKETNSVVGLPTIQCDNKSIVIHDDELELYGFKNAEEETVLTKKNGVARFTNLNGILKINQVDPDVNNTINLIQRYNTSTLINDTAVNLQVLNSIQDTHNIIEWIVKTNQQPVAILFDNRVLYEYLEDNVIPANSIFHYIFESFDQGYTWLERVHKYNIAQTNSRVDTSYLFDNYYTKPEVDNLIKWKNKDQQNLEES